MDRKQRDIGKDGNAAAEVVSPAAAAEPLPKLPRSEELFRQGEALYSQASYQQAIHVWTRILFLERGDARAKAAIERAKQAVAEQHRELDVEVAAAGRSFEAGALEAATARLEQVLAVDPRHPEAHQLAERIAARKRRTEARPAAPAVESRAVSSEDAAHASKRGVVLRVPKGADSRRRRDRFASLDVGSNAGLKTGLQMAAFVLAVVLVFASGALYLYLNWESIVSDGAFATGVAGVGGGRTVLDRSAPSASELHYYNGARLYAKGRYRQALAELSLVARGDETFDRARSLILRIEERLLRSGELSDGVSETASTVR